MFRSLGFFLGFRVLSLAKGLSPRVLGFGFGFGVEEFGIWLRVWVFGFWDLARGF